MTGRFALLCLCFAVAAASPYRLQRSKRQTTIVPDLVWMGWGKCSQDCDGGVQERSKFCTDTADGSRFVCFKMAASCNMMPCALLNDPWGPFSTCSAACGEGTRTRTRGTATETIECVNSCDTTAPASCGEADVVFLLDSSGSMGTTGVNWFRSKQFAADVASAFKVTPGQVRVGVVSFSTQVTANVEVGDYTSVDDLKDKIWAMPYMAGATNTAEGLRIAMGMLSDNQRQRMIVTVTDGQSNIENTTTVPVANQAKDDGIVIFSIGVDTQVNEAELKGIASEPTSEYYFRVASYEALYEISMSIATKACETSELEECDAWSEWSVCSATACEAAGQETRTKSCRLKRASGDVIRTVTKRQKRACVGEPCSDPDQCALGTHNCLQTCINLDIGFQCACLAGFSLAADGHTCIDVNECLLKTTNNCEQTCLNSDGSYSCGCNAGYRLAADDISCVDIDECVLGTAGCTHDCRNLLGSFVCSCNAGYALQIDAKTCIDMDECAVANGGCMQLCVNLPGSFECRCDAGYTLSTDGKLCVDIDECALGTAGCTQLCGNLPGSFACSCHAGYELQTDLKTCVDINECLLGTSGCAQLCENQPGTFVCSCEPGYVLHADAKTCLDVDECLLGTAGCAQICTNTIGSYLCDCEKGYELTADLHTCDLTCARCPTWSGIGFISDYEDCGMYYVCNGQTDTNPTHMPCPPGLFFDPEALNCNFEAQITVPLKCKEASAVVVDACADGSHGCQHDCVNTRTGFYCACHDGFKLDVDLKACIEVDCNLEADPTDITRYINDGQSMPCAPGTAWVQAACSCALQVINIPDACPAEDLAHPFLYFPFDDHFNDVRCNKALSDVFGKPAYSWDAKTNKALDLRAPGSRLAVPFLHNWFANREVTQWTVAVWIKPTKAMSGVVGIVNNGDCVAVPSFDISMERVGDDMVVAAGLDTQGQSYQQLPDSTVSVTDWTHVALVYDGAQIITYKNGEAVHSGVSADGKIQNRHCPMNIGHTGVDLTSGFFEGLIDELKIYRMALSGDDVKTIM